VIVLTGRRRWGWWWWWWWWINILWWNSATDGGSNYPLGTKAKYQRENSHRSPSLPPPLDSMHHGVHLYSPRVPSTQLLVGGGTLRGGIWNHEQPIRSSIWLGSAHVKNLYYETEGVIAWGGPPGNASGGALTGLWEREREREREREQQQQQQQPYSPLWFKGFIQNYQIILCFHIIGIFAILWIKEEYLGDCCDRTTTRMMMTMNQYSLVKLCHWWWQQLPLGYQSKIPTRK